MELLSFFCLLRGLGWVAWCLGFCGSGSAALYRWHNVGALIVRIGFWGSLS